MVLIQRDIIMSIYLKQYGLVSNEFNAVQTGISGSSRFCNVFSFFETSLRVKEKKTYVREAVESESEHRVRRKFSYGVNMKRLRDRLNAYVCLKQSRRFLAFYSVSFPAGTDRQVISRIWNSVLTSMREGVGLKSYIWVVELQGNGTAHYHLLTNNYMPIRAVNQIVAHCIDYYVKRGLASWGQSSVVKYNGVDVVNISKRAARRGSNHNGDAYRQVVFYVQKYMSKNGQSESGRDGEKGFRRWHCSRLVSALFVTVNLVDHEVEAVLSGDEKLLARRRIVHSADAVFVFFDAGDSCAWRDTIGRWNEMVYEYFEQHNLW